MKEKGKIIKFPDHQDEEETGVIRKLRRIFRLDPKRENKVTKLIPKDVRDRFNKLPTVDGKEISSFRDFLTYMVKKINDSEDDLYEYYNKIEIRWLEKEEYFMFISFFDQEIDQDDFFAHLIAYENKVMECCRIAALDENPLYISKFNSKAYFAKLMYHLFQERIESLE